MGYLRTSKGVAVNMACLGILPINRVLKLDILFNS